VTGPDDGLDPVERGQPVQDADAHRSEVVQRRRVVAELERLIAQVRQDVRAVGVGCLTQDVVEGRQ
jgi:hypothetical protein